MKKRHKNSKVSKKRFQIVKKILKIIGINIEKPLKKTAKPTTLNKERCLAVLLLFSVAILYVGGFLVYRMVFKGEFYKKSAQEQIINEIEIKAKRGKILDRNGQSLAISGDVYRVEADIEALEKNFNKKANIEKSAEKNEKYQKEFLITKLSEILGIEKENILLKLDAVLESGEKVKSAVIAKQISKEQADEIKKLDFYGILIYPDTKRYYPNDKFSAYVIGNVNSDGVGLNGIENYYNSVLSGISGVKIAELDGNKNLELPFNDIAFTPAIEGKNVVLTIDEKIQYFAERAAKRAYELHDPDSVNVLITNPNTNEILALATSPEYNPNKPYDGFEKFNGETENDKIQQMWRNKVVSDIYEPGSTFKLITAAIAIEEGVANNGESYNCNGYTVIDGQRINCWKRDGHGIQTFNQILENSCNMGLIDMGNKIGKEKLTAYIDKFGFGKETGIDITGESVGIIKKLEDMSEIDLATISFGQTNAVTMVQLITAFNSSINGGYLIRPHLMKEITSNINDEVIVIEDSYKITKEQVISEETSKNIRNALEGVVENGTGKNAYIEGFRVIGKTGTSEKVKEGGGYGQGRVASFIAAAPADNPKVSILVTVDNPKKGEASGSSMAAPVVKEILESIYSYNEIDDVELTKENNISFIMEEIRGLDKENAKKILEDQGLIVNLKGKGNIVKATDVLPGSMVVKGSVINLELTNSSKIENKIIVPNFEGYTKEMAKNLCKKIGLNAKFDIEDGNVRLQSVKNGETIKSKSDIKFILTQNKEN
ncbi:MAG: penicillin-binding transpeptidase domain-containing protein [Sarcina sp.]